MTLSLEKAVEIVRENLGRSRVQPPLETVPLAEAGGRVLAADVAADRDYPPFPRSARDGFAVRSEDIAAAPVTLECVGEIPAGGHFDGRLGPGQCISIMTGAPAPEGAHAVVMVEHTRVEGARVTLLKPVAAAENIVARGSEAAAGQRVLERGRRLDAGSLALLASIGVVKVPVFQRPEVAILPTGDELVRADEKPEWFQIRESNSYSLAAQVERAGGVPRVLGIAADDELRLRNLITRGAESRLLLLSGGVSAGKYDFVEKVLADLGSEFYFDSVAIRPGKPLVFGKLGEVFFFGLPGNPVSTYVTFELLVRPAISALAGAGFETPLVVGARLARAVKRREGLTAFVPARVEYRAGAPEAAPVAWQGSGDLVGLAAANCFLVIHPDREPPQAGEWVDVILKSPA